MKTQTSINGNDYIISVTGRIDTTTASDFEEVIRSIPETAKSVTFDFNCLDYVSSAGLRTLLMCKKKMSGDKTMKLVGVNSIVKEILDSTGFTRTLGVVELKAEKNNTEIPFREFLKEKISSEGNKEVFLFAGKHITWSEIGRNSAVIAEKLVGQGVKKRTHVGICGMNSANWIYTFFAVQELGAIAVLMNFNLKPSEMTALSKIGSITHLCYGDIPGMMQDPDYMKKVMENPETLTKSYCDIGSHVDFGPEYREDLHIPEEYIEADDPAVIFFSSGTTSQPKAIILSGYNVFNDSHIINIAVPMTRNDKVCIALPLFHIFGFMSSFMNCATAGVLICIPQSMRSEDILKMLSSEHCTIMHSVPTLLLAIAANPNFGLYDVSSLRVSFIAGAAIAPSQLKFLKEKFPKNNFGIAYGMSEIAPATITRLPDTDEHIYHTIGEPVPGVSVKIQNCETGAECKVNESGEILLKSPNQMVGYYNLDIDKQPTDQDGWLHTGDLGFVAEDGYIHQTGRVKDLIIRGGENIAPKEVAEAIAAFDNVEDVQVLGVPSAFWGEEVGAGIIMKQGSHLDKKALTEFLIPRLSRFKIPEYVFEYERFPLLANGKIDILSLKNDLISRVREEKA
jgi:fatty-acyl-CoA synthase